MLASVHPGHRRRLDLQRVLQFLPFFVLGLCLRPEHFRLVRRRSVRILAVPVFAAAALVFALVGGPADERRAGSPPGQAAQDLGAPWSAGRHGAGAVRLLAGADRLFPRLGAGPQMWCTVLGAGTLYGYLLHGF